jgi:gamma-glutamylcyclotransferase (GGCT)/AIG2-like uncharacterized protein YtfP
LLIAFYGTLMRGCGATFGDVGEATALEGPCGIPGLLWDLGEYPGLTEGEGEVVGELHRILDERALETLDAYEDEGSLFLRKRVRLIEPEVEAWVYVYAGSLARATPIVGGCWRTHAGAAANSQGRRYTGFQP